MNVVAFITYNNLGGVADSGWHEQDGRKALVLQGTTGRPWLADQTVPKGSTQFEQDVKLVSNTIGDLWSQLVAAISDLDQVVVYVGDSGSEHAIELAAQLPPEKVTFVLCSCGWSRKTSRIQSRGLSGARVVQCECGGRSTMGGMFRSFMNQGQL